VIDQVNSRYGFQIKQLFLHDPGHPAHPRLIQKDLQMKTGAGIIALLDLPFRDTLSQIIF